MQVSLSIKFLRSSFPPPHPPPPIRSPVLFLSKHPSSLRFGTHYTDTEGENKLMDAPLLFCLLCRLLAVKFVLFLIEKKKTFADGVF